jgi:hypothetical protein
VVLKRTNALIKVEMSARVTLSPGAVATIAGLLQVWMLHLLK